MEKQRWEESDKRRAEKRRSEKRKSEKKEDAGAGEGRKVAIQCVFPMTCGSGGSKIRLAKAAGAEPAGQMRDEKVHAVVARSTFPSQNVQNTSAPEHFRSCAVEKVQAVVARSTFPSQNVQNTSAPEHFRSCAVEKAHAVVARSTFRSQNAQNTPGSDHIWKLRCRKSARRCGAKHISKSKCPKHFSFGALVEVATSKKCTPLWREAHFEVKSVKTDGFRALLKVEMSKKCTPLWGEAHLEVNMLKTLNARTTF